MILNNLMRMVTRYVDDKMNKYTKKEAYDLNLCGHCMNNDVSVCEDCGRDGFILFNER